MMNRETELHFSNVPEVNRPRSIFDRSHSVITTWNTGQIIPIMVDGDITPGDTVSMDISHVIRMATPIFPVFDNMVADIMAFFVPKRLVWSDNGGWKKFWGESDDPYGVATDLEEPQLEAPEGGWACGSIVDYMGVATYVEDDISALQVRGYCQIWNDWFRDENNKSAVHIYKDDTTRTGNNLGLSPLDVYDYVTDAEGGGAPLMAAKLHDYYTSALPSPQRGPDVLLPLGTKANVFTGPSHGMQSPSYPSEKYGMEFGVWDVETGTESAFAASRGYLPTLETATATPETQKKAEMFWNGDTTTQKTSSGYVFAPSNLYADLTNATAATIDQLRTAISLQHYYEARSRYGTRYIEVLKGLFGVTSADARLQRAEYLGGVRVPVNMDTVLQTSATDAVTPQANASGYSCTVGKNNLFTKSFEEHGILYVLVVCRHENTYQQGIPKQFLRKKNTDYYNPYFAHLTEQPIKLKQLYATGTSADEEVFGYQEPFAEMRYADNIVTGMMRSNTPGGGLDAWHYADYYTERPYLSSEWIDADKSAVDRTLAVNSSKAHQFLGNFWIKAIYTREMPVYGTPGLTRI